MKIKPTTEATLGDAIRLPRGVFILREAYFCSHFEARTKDPTEYIYCDEIVLTPGLCPFHAEQALERTKTRIAEANREQAAEAARKAARQLLNQDRALEKLGISKDDLDQLIKDLNLGTD